MVGHNNFFITLNIHKNTVCKPVFRMFRFILLGPKRYFFLLPIIWRTRDKRRTYNKMRSCRLFLFNAQCRTSEYVVRLLSGIYTVTYCDSHIGIVGNYSALFLTIYCIWPESCQYYCVDQQQAQRIFYSSVFTSSCLCRRIFKQ